MVPVQRLGHVTIETQDIERALEYYEQVTGLVATAHNSKTVHLASKLGLLAITLVKSDRSDCTKQSFEIARDIRFRANRKNPRE